MYVHYIYIYIYTLSFVGIEAEMDSRRIVFKWDIRIKINFMQSK